MDALTARDWPAVSAIYEEGIETRHATFETDAPSWEDVGRGASRRAPARRRGATARSSAGRRSRACLGAPCYRGVAEDSVYVARGARSQGVGRALLDELVASSGGGRDLDARRPAIFPENLASLALHLACGFRVVGVRERHRPARRRLARRRLPGTTKRGDHR